MRIWNTLFLEQRPSIGLSFFRIFVALTVGLRVIPSFYHLDDNYLSTAFKTFNYDLLVYVVVVAFIITWFCFLIGLFSQLSCILMTACCCYFYALNAFHIGTLSWDILFVTLFLMCVTPYHGDYFSIDALRRGDTDAWHHARPFFIQRLLQLQIAAMFLFISLHKIIGNSNWITSIPIFLFSAQMLLFIHPQRIIEWIESKRADEALRPRPQVIYDSGCGFCRASVRALQVMDLWGKLQYTPGPQDLTEMRLDFPGGKTYGGFFAFRRLTWILPMLYPAIPIVYFPGSGMIGPLIYRWVARHRYLFPVFHVCAKGACDR